MISLKVMGTTFTVLGIVGLGAQFVERVSVDTASTPAPATPLQVAAESVAGEESAAESSTVVISIDGDIDTRSQRVLKSGLATAERSGAENVIVTLDSRGGDLDTAIEMMQDLADAQVRTILYVAEDAAGPAAVLPLAVERVFVHPRGVIGPIVLETDSTEDTSLDSYRESKVLASAARGPRREALIRAMLAPGETLEFGGETLSEPGRLLALRSGQALLTEGDPPTPLLAEGEARRLEDLLEQIVGDAEAPYRHVKWDARKRTIVQPMVNAGEDAGSELLAETGGTDTPSDREGAADGTEDAPRIGELPDPGEDGIFDVYVVPIRGGIDEPQLYILRRALKQAIEEDVEAIVLDMDTPGGRLDTTLEMMEALARFEGKTITYVNSDAISAGAYISVATEHIYMSPTGVIGAAAAVSGGGGEIPPTMKAKINSVLDGIIRTYADEYPFRARVLRAMADISADLVINGEPVVSAEGESLGEPGRLLTLTAKEAVLTFVPEDIERFGPEPRPLLATGIASNLDELLDQRFGAGNYRITEFEVTWSEKASKWLVTIAPLLFPLGLILLYLEAQSPTFGLMGGLGLLFLAAFFGGHLVAGLAGYEDILLFAIGCVLILAEIFFFPGTLILGLTGASLVLASLVWAMSDNWPTEGFDVSADLLLMPTLRLILGLFIGIVTLLLLGRFLPKKMFWDRIVLRGSLQPAGHAPLGDTLVLDEAGGSTAAAIPDIGSKGKAVTALFPSGEVEIDGRRYQARAMTGMVERGQNIKVTGQRDFTLIVSAE